MYSTSCHYVNDPVVVLREIIAGLAYFSGKMSNNDSWFFTPVDGHGILVVLLTFFMNGNKTITNSWLSQDLINVVSCYTCLDYMYESRLHYRPL